MTTRSELLDKLLKIRELAVRGENGERESAISKLNELMDRYGFTEEDLELPKMYFFKYNRFDKMSKRLLNQIMYSVVGDVECFYHEKKADLGCECTKSEAIEIEAKYGFYYTELKKDLDCFVLAFIMKNHIYPPKSKITEDEDIKADDEPIKTVSDLSRKAYLMSALLEKKDFYKQLED